MSTRTPGTQIQLGSIFLMDYDLNLLRIASITNPGGINPPGQGPEHLFGYFDQGYTNANSLKGLTPQQTQMLSASKWVDTNMRPNSTLAFSLTGPASLVAYVFMTANDAPARDPTSWALYAVQGGVRTQIDLRTNIQPPTDRWGPNQFFYRAGSEPPPMPPPPDRHRRRRRHRRRLPAAGAPSTRAAGAASPPASPGSTHYQFVFTETRLPPTAFNGDPGIQLGSLRLIDHVGNLIPICTITNPGGRQDNAITQTPMNLLNKDGGRGTKWYDGNFATNGRSTIIVELCSWYTGPGPNGYMFYTAFDVSRRDPISWQFGRVRTYDGFFEVFSTVSGFVPTFARDARYMPLSTDPHMPTDVYTGRRSTTLLVDQSAAPPSPPPPPPGAPTRRLSRCPSRRYRRARRWTAAAEPRSHRARIRRRRAPPPPPCRLDRPTPPSSRLHLLPAAIATSAVTIEASHSTVRSAAPSAPTSTATAAATASSRRRRPTRRAGTRSR